MNKRKHDWKHFSRRTLSLILVLVTLVALCIPTGMALEDNSADAETQPAAVQTAETENGADTGAAATSETDAQPVAETEPTAEVEQESVAEPEGEQTSEPKAAVSTPVETQTAQPTVSEPETTEPEQTTVPTVAASSVQTVSEPETTEEINTIDLGSNEADALAATEDENAVAEQALTTINISIDDQIKQNGILKVNVPADVTLGTDVTFKWFKDDNKDGSFTTEVTRRKVTGSNYNVTKFGEELNVVLDDGAQKWYIVKAYNADGAEIASAGSVHVNYYNQVQNGSFENPSVTDGSGYNQFSNDTPNLIWKTTGSDKAIELVNKNKSGPYYYYGITNVAAGNQFAELNCEAVGTLYQDVMTMPYSTLNWQLYHSARLKCMQQYYNGSDIMYVMIMSTVKAEQLGNLTQTQIQQIVDILNNDTITNKTYNNVSLDDVSLAKIEDGGTWYSNRYSRTCTRYYVDETGKHTYSASDSKVMANQEWTRWRGAYRVPNGQYMTRFFFVSYSCASGNPTVGNMLDDVRFTTEALPADPDRGNLTVTKVVTGLDQLPDDYSVTVSGGAGLEYTFVANEFTANSDGNWVASHTFSNIEIGNYTVSETQVSTVDNYECTADGEKNVTVRDGETATASFTNSYELSVGTLTINKTITGLGADELAALKNTLTFTATATDNSDSFTFKLTDTDVVDNGNGSYTFTKEGLKAGTTYKVEEGNADVTHYNRATSGEGNVTIKAKETVSVDIVNNYTKNVGDLTIVKNIQVDSKWMTDKELNDLKKNITFTATNAVTHEEKTFTGTWNENTFTATITDLPVGTTWTVSEANYELEYHNCTAAFTDGKDSATIKADEVQKVEITNTYTDKLIDLTITKSVSGKHSHDASFTFIATNNRTGVSYTLTIVGSNTDVIKQIPAGNYTIKELDNDNYEHVGQYEFTEDIVANKSFTFKNNGTGDSYQYSSSAVNKGAVNKDGTIIFSKPEKINKITKTN